MRHKLPFYLSGSVIFALFLFFGLTAFVSDATACSCYWRTFAVCHSNGCMSIQGSAVKMCNPYGCGGAEIKCTDSCTCECHHGSYWTDTICNAPACGQGMRMQRRVCNPSEYLEYEYKCVADATCNGSIESLNLFMTAAPSSGNAPLDVSFTWNIVNPDLHGDINYRMWWNCPSSCSNVGACKSACGTWNYEGKNLLLPITHTYGSVGTYSPRLVITQHGYQAAAGQTINVSNCTCGSFADNGCGAGGCDSRAMYQTRTCNPAGCDAQSRCGSDSSCITAVVDTVATPESDNNPLETEIEATVSGNATGNINYTLWRDCVSACNSVASCEAACGVWTDKADNQADASHKFNVMYDLPGTYHPLVLVERESRVATSSTQVVSIQNTAPFASITDVEQPPACGTSPSAIFSWTYGDAENDDQKAYRVQISEMSDFSGLLIDDSSKINSTSSFSWAPALGIIDYGKTYYWRLKLWDAAGSESDWIIGNSFDSFAHPFPVVDFDFQPKKPKVGGLVEFYDASQNYSPGGLQNWSWVFQNATPGVSGGATTSAVFTTQRESNATLTVTDAEGYSCSGSQVVNAKMKPPQWIEIAPYQQP